MNDVESARGLKKDSKSENKFDSSIVLTFKNINKRNDIFKIKNKFSTANL